MNLSLSNINKSDRLLIAVSGGLDSVVLCELCYREGFSFAMAHCNFQLRGEESNRDEDFVLSLGKKYGVEVFVKRFDTESYAAENKMSIQETARTLRYEWFKEIISDWGTNSFILTAHHANDNAETMLMNFCRGTGLQGLTGIPARSGKILRPLLGFYRDELRDFATVNKLEYVEDSSNSSTKYTRNLFRLEIIPAIEKVYGTVTENLNDNAARFKNVEALYAVAVGKIIAKLCRNKGNEVHVPVKQLMEFNNEALIYELIKQYGFNEKQVNEVIKLASSETGRYINSPDGNFRLLRHRHWFIISPVEPGESEYIIIEGISATISFANGSLMFSSRKCKESVNLPAGSDKDVSAIYQTGNEIAQLDENMIEFPLLLRKWKAGDYFYPLGMKKKKKLSRFFIDQKISRTEKDRIWVLEMNKKIIWVPGYRIDDRFRITKNTKKILQVTFTPTS